MFGYVIVNEKQLSEAEQKVVRLQKGADGEPEELPFEDEQP